MNFGRVKDNFSISKFQTSIPNLKVKGVQLYVTSDYYLVETLQNFYIFDNFFQLKKEVIKGFSNFIQVGIYKDLYFYYLDERDSKIVYVNMCTKQRKATQIELRIFFPCGERIFGIMESHNKDSYKELISIDLEPELLQLKFQCNESIHHVQYLHGFTFVVGSNRFLFKLYYHSQRCLHGTQLPIDVLDFQVFDRYLLLSSQDSKQILLIDYETLDIVKTLNFQLFSSFYPLKDFFFIFGDEDLALYDIYQNRMMKEEHRQRIKINTCKEKVLFLQGDTFHVLKLKKKLEIINIPFLNIHFHFH